MHWIALQPLAPDTADLSDELVTLGWWALQFTPKVARVQNMLVMEVSASERLFGGRRQLLAHLFESSKALAPVNHRRGATSLIAIARLQMAFSQGTSFTAARTPPQTRIRIRVDELPLHTLAAALPHVGTLAHIGCNTWGTLRALPRGGVARRFGTTLLDALDCAYGLKPELYPWLLLPEAFEAKLELQAQVDSAPALMFGAQRLLKQLQRWLQLRQQGLLAMEMGWTMDARRNTATQGLLVVRTAEPTQDIAHLQRLMGENLAKITLPAPVLHLSLRSLQTEKMAGQSASLLLEDVQKGDSLHQMLERVSARLGAGNVLQLKRHADHRPEQMQAWIPVFDLSKLLASNRLKPTTASRQTQVRAETSADSPLYPTWLLAKPLALRVQHNIPHCMGPLALLARPHRLETGWWGEFLGDGECALRDYYIAHNEHAGLVWIYRERLSGRAEPSGQTNPSGLTNQVEKGAEKGAAGAWYLHGLFG